MSDDSGDHASMRLFFALSGNLGVVIKISIISSLFKNGFEGSIVFESGCGEHIDDCMNEGCKHNYC
ncbi:unnamed protein product [Pneumocystis jirovecii]|uniref:Uncharacterized protein n=1 Tax=Pneumocystis jirovecii TaxID=42068 RepID=L0P9L5_PNEJI|nr:unnamed protein product [Pneumocystis jirovecii]